MWLRWFPWNIVVSRFAQARGFIDPIRIFSRLESFAQPREVKESPEVLRAGMVLHARGLLNGGAMQHRRDWVWPLWAERQYDPRNDAFIPRAFAVTQVNLTRRNWTAIGIPDCSELPIVDPHGLLTPFWDSWSLDAWIVRSDGRALFPSRLPAVDQRILLDHGMAVETRSSAAEMELTVVASVAEENGHAVCRMEVTGDSRADASLVIALRPLNPEGVSFVHFVASAEAGDGWRVDRDRAVKFSEPPGRMAFSDFRGGDVRSRLFGASSGDGTICRVGMATAAALFALPGSQRRTVTATIPLEPPRADREPRPSWASAAGGTARLYTPDAKFESLFNAAIRALVLHTPAGEVFAGPYTSRRFWFRNTAFIIQALVAVGLYDRAERIIDAFADRQMPTGYFMSQEKEWDSNGQALWAVHQFSRMTGLPPKTGWMHWILSGAQWIVKSRDKKTGLLPPGFSSENLGPIDTYYWDDFWAVAGLRAAADLLDSGDDPRRGARFRDEAERLLVSIQASLAAARSRIGDAAMPASPSRGLDSGVIGNLAASYPLQLFSARDPRVLRTLEFLVNECFVNGAYYQDILDSGVSPHMTLHVAQALLRAGDPRALDLLYIVAALASPTGQWAEGLHPDTKSGCHGDGQFAWTSAEWILMVRNLFVREEADRLIIGSGIFPEWLEQREVLSFGPTPTAFGIVTVSILPGERTEVSWSAGWRGEPPTIEVQLPGYPIVTAAPGTTSVEVAIGAIAGPTGT